MNELFLKIINDEHIGKLACPGCADSQTCFEESSQMGQCSALGYRCSQIDLPVFFRERIEPDSKR